MTTAKPAPKTRKKKRVPGRPVAGKNDVGSERLLIAAERLLQTLPPARVNILRIAEAANADPALVRYYFGDRIKLLMAVADRVIVNAPRVEQRAGDPQTALAERIAATVQFVRHAPFMHRLIIDELTDAGTDESRAKVRDMNLGLVDFYRQILGDDDGATMIDADPLLLHLAVLGASDFFASAEPLIRQLMPEAPIWRRSRVIFRRFWLMSS